MVPVPGMGTWYINVLVGPIITGRSLSGTSRAYVPGTHIQHVKINSRRAVGTVPSRTYSRANVLGPRALQTMSSLAIGHS